MTEHRLDPLLQPSSIALLGASERAGSPGYVLASMVIKSEFSGVVYPVNPGYTKIHGLPCFADLAALPQRVEHVVIALGNEHLETALAAVIEHGAQAATIYSSGVLEADTTPPLKQRLADMARSAGLQLCGINGMGYYNLERQLYVGIYNRPQHIMRGGISYIAQSGSAFTALVHNGCRLGFNLCVSAGDEMTTTAADYMDWCLERDDTRVIGLFLETVRDPDAFVAALEKANAKAIPVVILKIGKSPLGASMAVSHTGAIAGDYAVFQALCRRHNAIEVDDLDEMAAMLMLLQRGHELTAGGFAAVFESGGLRELITDSACALGLDFAELGKHTVNEIKRHLEPGLKAENPLDIWGSHRCFEARMEACLRALMQDPNIAAGVFFSSFRDDYFLSEATFRVVERINRESSKPLVLANCYTDLANTALCQRSFAAGIPVLDGMRESLLAFKRLFHYRNFSKPAAVQQHPGATQLRHWRKTLGGRGAGALSESEALALLNDFSIPVVAHASVSTEAELIVAAAELGYPVVLKTAQPGIHHKSDCGGVVVGIANEPALVQAYRDMAARLGPLALVSQMADAGIEVALGTVNDRQFGPVIMVAAGGILIELLDDRSLAICPVSHAQAEQMLAELKLNRQLLGMRGKPAVDRQALIDCIVALSQIAFALGDCIAEIDVNPLFVNTRGALAVDALVVGKMPSA